MTSRLELDGATFSVSGRWIAMASIPDELWIPRDARDPGRYLRALESAGGKTPDIFTFAQDLADRVPRHQHRIEWESIAAIALTTSADWWARLSHKSRSDVRRARTRGVTTAIVPFGGESDELVRGIVDINNAAAMRQGRRFSHFGESLDVVRRTHATYLDRSTFIGAYLGGELIGYTKIVRVDDTASVMQFLVKPEHYDKRPSNALITAAVESAVNDGARFLKYGSFRYGNKTASSLTAFKHRVGFEEMLVPRYFVPLTTTGRAAVALGLHRRLIGIVPSPFIGPLLQARRAWSRVVVAASTRPARR